jgi:hypothetical protein
VTPKYACFMNVEYAKTFKEADLEALANWDLLPKALSATPIYRSEILDGRVVNFNSEPEWKTYLALKENGYIQSFRAQSLMIPYASYLSYGKQYFPDFVFLTSEGYLAIVESKPTSNMNTYMVRCKYEALKQYCEERGFIFAMVDERLTSFERIKAQKINHPVTQYFDAIFDEVGIFNDEALKLIYQKFPQYTHKEIKAVLGHYVLQRDLVNKSSVGFNIKKHRRFNEEKLFKMRSKKAQS